MQLEASKFHVAVIGGGIIGMSVAYHLSKSGCTDVIVLEKDTVGSGTTAKSLGGFRHQYSTNLNISFSVESIRFLTNFKKAFGIDISIRNDGYLFLASDEEQMQSLERQVTMQRELGVDALVLKTEEIKRLCPYLELQGIIGASYGPSDGHADTSAVLQGYTKEARENGVIISEETEVLGFQYEHKGKEIRSVTTSKGNINADHILLCAGPYTGKLSKLLGLNLPVYPVPRTILVTHRYEGIPNQIPQIFDLKTTLGIGQSGFSGIHLGIRNKQPKTSSFEIIEDPSYPEAVIAEAIKRMPSLKKASLAHTLSGLYEQTPDSNPIIGKIGENLYVASGFSGHGFMHSPVIGRVVSELILNGKCRDFDLSEFSPERFSTPKVALERLAI